jgi:hypothetical protein
MDTQQERDEKAVQECIDKLSGQFDTVHIFVARHEGGENGGTVNFQQGTGDWFSRYGIVRMWVTRVEEQTRAKARKDFEQEEENEN